MDQNNTDLKEYGLLGYQSKEVFIKRFILVWFTLIISFTNEREFCYRAHCLYIVFSIFRCKCLGWENTPPFLFFSMLPSVLLDYCSTLLPPRVFLFVNWLVFSIVSFPASILHVVVAVSLAWLPLTLHKCYFPLENVFLKHRLGIVECALGAQCALLNPPLPTCSLTLSSIDFKFSASCYPILFMYVHKYFVEFARNVRLWRSARHGYQWCARRLTRRCKFIPSVC